MEFPNFIGFGTCFFLSCERYYFYFFYSWLPTQNRYKNFAYKRHAHFENIGRIENLIKIKLKSPRHKAKFIRDVSKDTNPKEFRYIRHSCVVLAATAVPAWGPFAHLGATRGGSESPLTYSYYWCVKSRHNGTWRSGKASGISRKRT